jgi:hypothetical protein
MDPRSLARERLPMASTLHSVARVNGSRRCQRERAGAGARGGAGASGGAGAGASSGSGEASPSPRRGEGRGGGRATATISAVSFGGPIPMPTAAHLGDTKRRRLGAPRRRPLLPPPAKRGEGRGGGLAASRKGRHTLVEPPSWTADRRRVLPRGIRRDRERRLDHLRVTRTKQRFSNGARCPSSWQ